MSSSIWPWFDIETTGLSADKDVILELGIVLTDKMGNEIDSFDTLIKEPTWAWRSRVDEIRDATQVPDLYVRKMHEDSGLLEELLDDTAGACTTSQAEYLAIEFLNDHGVKPQSAEMFGSSIGSLDRPFILHQMPHLNEWLHYRNMDNSSLKILVQNHRPDLLAKLPKSEDEKAHRVLDDCRFSISEYQFYLKNFLRPNQPIARKKVTK